jgi:hypothetical protein
MKNKLHAPVTVTEKDGQYFVTGYREPEPQRLIQIGPNIRGLKTNPEHQRWLQSKVTLPVSDGSKEELKSILLHLGFLPQDLVKNSTDISSMANRLEIFCETYIHPNGAGELRDAIKLIPEQKEESEYLSIELLKEYAFKECPENTFKDLVLPYFAKDAVLIFFNKLEIEWQVNRSFLVGYGDMRSGNYHVVTFRWVTKLSELKEIFKAIKGIELTKQPVI